MKWLKKTIEDMYKNHKTIFILFMYLSILIFAKISSSFISSHLEEIKNIGKHVEKNQQNIRSITIISQNLSNDTEKILKKMDEDERHYQLFDDEISLKIGMLEGRFSVIEKLFYDLNRSQLEERNCP